MNVAVLGFEVPGAILVQGAVFGLTYGILAVGLILVFRMSKVINFAHGEIGALGAGLLGVAVVQWHIPYWLAFIPALAVSAGIGALTEIAVIRRLRNVPKLVSLVATIGVAQFLLLLSSALKTQVLAGSSFPQPPGLPRFHIGVLLVTPAYSAMLFVAPVVVGGLALFLKRSRYGLAILGTAANPERAKMAGIFASRMTTLVWAIAGGLAAFTAALIVPTRGFITAESLGPNLLLRALVAAVMARMTSLPIALGAGLVVGLVEGPILHNYPQVALPEVVLFVAIGIALLVQSPRAGREGDRDQEWAAVQPWPPLPDRVRELFMVRNLGWFVAAIGFALTVVLAIVVTNAAAISLVVVLAFSLVGLSLGILTGLAGQLSLGQFALAGVGFLASHAVVSRTGNFALGLAAAAAMAMVLSLVIGLPALRIRGLMLAVTTLSFALAAQWFFEQPWGFGDGIAPGRPIFGGFALDTPKRYLFFALVVFALGLWLTRNIWRGDIGLRFRAVRDNEDAARAFGVRGALTKLQAFMLAGAIAGLGGAVYGHLLSQVTGRIFDIVSSVNIVALTVLGGVALLVGPILGALYIVGVPTFIPLDSAGLAATSLGWLILILYFPGGLAQTLRPLRDRYIRWAARGLDLETAPPSDARSFNLAPRVTSKPADRDGVREQPLLTVEGLRKHYGGIIAVDGASFNVHAHEILGLIGPNGAGKTTTFEIVSGFTRPDSGVVVFDDTDITTFAPERRAHLGLVRSFQDAALFPTLTVLEAVTLAHERLLPPRFLASIVGLRGRQRRRDYEARDLIGLMGLEAFAAKQIRQLSTGTRRVAELACMVALQPTLLLLDEPSSGIAQKETEALGVMLEQLRRSLGVTMIIIEHDIPLIMRISDRIIAMESGVIISEGTPKAVKMDPRVIESYLGADVRTTSRSDEVKARR